LKKHIWFIVNPVSGGKNKKLIPGQIEKLIDPERFNAEIVITTSSQQTRDIAHQAVQKNLDAVIAVGGDGTINDIASRLVNSSVALGIIPFGSGNGFARALKIPVSVKQSIALINRFQLKDVDACFVNGHFFCNVGGVGFDAHIANQFQTSVSRGLWNYTKLVLRELRFYKPRHYKLLVDDQPYETDAFLITVCNGNQFGNNAFIAPGADLSDGLMNVVILENCSLASAPKLAWQLFSGTISSNPNVKTFLVKKLELVQPNSERLVNVDGEAVAISESLEFSLMQGALKVLV